MGYAFILQSKNLNEFYVDACHENLVARIENNNSGTHGPKTFTSQITDSELFIKFSYDDYPHAVRLQRKIKSMKSSKDIRNLLKHPELRQMILGEKRKVCLTR